MTLPTRKTIAASVAAALAGSLLMLAGPTAHAQSAGLRLMPLGDSITAGNQSSTGNGYRGPLWPELINDGDALDFVGSQRNGVMFDPDNEGHPSYKIADIANLVNGSLALNQPNVVTLCIGVNDLGQAGASPSATANSLGSLIDQIIANDPGVTILVAQLIVNATGWVQTNINAYNNLIPGIVQARVNAGKHVYTVNMSSLNLGDLSDGLHPNDGGYQKMADNWHGAIRQVISMGWVANINFAGKFEIQSVSSGQALDVSGGSTANGAVILQWPYGGGSNQLWNFIPTSNGYYQIKNAYSALDVNVVGASTANGAKIVQWQFGNQGNDQWFPTRQNDGSYVFYNRNSGSLLDNPGGTVQGFQFDQWGANGGANQRFNVIGR